MTEQKNQKTEENVKEPDLSLSNLLPMSLKEMKKILDNKKTLEQISKDQRHVQILIYQMLRYNTKAIKNFNRSSALLSIAILILVIVELILAIY
jgi:hypothetical protein